MVFSIHFYPEDCLGDFYSINWKWNGDDPQGDVWCLSVRDGIECYPLGPITKQIETRQEEILCEMLSRFGLKKDMVPQTCQYIPPTIEEIVGISPRYLGVVRRIIELSYDLEPLKIPNDGIGQIKEIPPLAVGLDTYDLPDIIKIFFNLPEIDLHEMLSY